MRTGGSQKTCIRCRPWRAKRGPVVRGRRRSGRIVAVATGRIVPEPRRGYAERIRHAVKPSRRGWRSPAAAQQRARGGADPGAGRTGAIKAVAKERVRPAAGATGRIHERHATLRFELRLFILRSYNSALHLGDLCAQSASSVWVMWDQ